MQPPATLPGPPPVTRRSATGGDERPRDNETCGHEWTDGIHLRPHRVTLLPFSMVALRQLPWLYFEEGRTVVMPMAYLPVAPISNAVGGVESLDRAPPAADRCEADEDYRGRPPRGGFRVEPTGARGRVTSPKRPSPLGWVVTTFRRELSSKHSLEFSRAGMATSHTPWSRCERS
jgi:hypothetical protein